VAGVLLAKRVMEIHNGRWNRHGYGASRIRHESEYGMSPIRHVSRHAWEGSPLWLIRAAPAARKQAHQAGAEPFKEACRISSKGLGPKKDARPFEANWPNEAGWSLAAVRSLKRLTRFRFGACILQGSPRGIPK
jgi:hypothetical protein